MMQYSNIFSNKKLTIVVNVILILAFFFVANSFWSYKNYTLDEDGRWESTKASLKGLNGVYANLYTKVALRRNRLDLGAWFGYMELICKKELKPGSVQFRYYSFEYPFSFIFDRSDSLTSGVFFNYKRDSSCFLFIADKDGRFLYKKNFDLKSNIKNYA